MKLFHPNLHDIAVRNCTDAMVRTLALELGVRVEALRKLGVGYLPVVQFKKGNNFDGHWTFPERDATGNIIGLSLRNRLDGKRKPMFPGSKHGLFFCPSDVDRNQNRNFRWGGSPTTRVEDAGITCPVCGKPDWCLVDDPNDPKAVICPRTKDGAAKDLGEAGYLHYVGRDDDSLSTGPSSTRPSSHSDLWLVVEGATDTLAAYSLGYKGVGRPSFSGGLTELAQLLRGADVVVIGENDRKADGSWPGKDGVEKCEQALTLTAKRVRVLFPPPEFKDLRTWATADRLSPEALAEWITAHSGSLRGVAESTPNPLPDDEVATIATAFLAKHGTEDGQPTLFRCDGIWYSYDADGWTPAKNDDIVRNRVGKFMRENTALSAGRGGSVNVVSLNPTSGRVESAYKNLGYERAVDAHLPCWLDGRTTPDPQQILCFDNGRLPVSCYLRGDYTLEPHDPHLLTATRLPFAFDVAAKAPRWDAYLHQALGDDPNKIALLQEWFGYNLIPDNSFEKMLMMIGLPGSGKGTALTVLRELLGPRNYTAMSMKRMSTQFGNSAIPGKLALLFQDALLPRGDRGHIVAALLAITGGDAVEMERKYKDTETLVPYCRITVATNNIPELPSENEALRRRIMFIRFAQDFSANPDRTLKEYLVNNEMPGIMTWSLEGLARLLTNGMFTVTAGQEEEERLFRNVTNPMGEFMEKWIIRDAGRRVSETALREAYMQYAEERGLKRHSNAKLFDLLQSLHQHIRREQVIERGETVTYITGIDLRPWARGLDNQDRRMA